MSTGLLFVLAILSLILIPLAPKLVRLRIRFLRWIHWNWAVNFQIYVSSFPDADRRTLISDDQGSAPRWGPQGDELFYLSAQGLMRVTLEFDDGLDVGTPEALFPLAGYVPTFDVAPDGRRFLLFKEDPDLDTEPQVVLVQSWLDELNRLVPIN